MEDGGWWMEVPRRTVEEGERVGGSGPSERGDRIRFLCTGVSVRVEISGGDHVSVTGHPGNG